MNFSDTYEAQLRSYIQSRTETLQNTLEKVVKNRSKINAAHLEQQIDHETDNFIGDITRRLHQIRDEIKSHRPKNDQEPDYAIRMKQYQQFVQSSSIGMNQVTNRIHSMLEKVISIVKSINQWIFDHEQSIVDITAQIRDTFTSIKTIFK